MFLTVTKLFWGENHIITSRNNNSRQRWRLYFEFLLCNFSFVEMIWKVSLSGWVFFFLRRRTLEIHLSSLRHKSSQNLKPKHNTKDESSGYLFVSAKREAIKDCSQIMLLGHQKRIPLYPAHRQKWATFVKWKGVRTLWKFVKRYFLAFIIIGVVLKLSRGRFCLFHNGGDGDLKYAPRLFSLKGIIIIVLVNIFVPIVIVIVNKVTNIINYAPRSHSKSSASFILFWRRLPKNWRQKNRNKYRYIYILFSVLMIFIQYI